MSSALGGPDGAGPSRNPYLKWGYAFGSSFGGMFRTPDTVELTMFLGGARCPQRAFQHGAGGPGQRVGVNAFHPKSTGLSGTPVPRPLPRPLLTTLRSVLKQTNHHDQIYSINQDTTARQKQDQNWHTAPLHPKASCNVRRSDAARILGPTKPSHFQSPEHASESPHRSCRSHAPVPRVRQVSASSWSLTRPKPRRRRAKPAWLG